MEMPTNASKVQALVRSSDQKPVVEPTNSSLFSMKIVKKIRTSPLLLGFAASLLAALAAVSIAAGPPNAAPTPPAQVHGLGSSSQVAYQNGAFTSSMQIEVPQFHGVTPSIGLNYSSSGSNGFVGVGYSLSGFPEFEREYKGGTIVYRYDGEPLILSSAMGGNYATIRQSFLKINLSGSVWTVTRPDGTAMTFTQSSVSTNNWLLSKVQDIHGNVANYAWAYDYINRSAYPYTITYGVTGYGRTVVTFYKETRTDIDSYASHPNGLSKRTYRLKSIGVKVDTNQLRSYKLTYGYSARTGRSLLKNIQKFGRDAAVDSTGKITGGVGLPQSTATWSDNTNGFENVSDISTSYGLTAEIWSKSFFHNGDFNGDGKEDLLLRYNPGTINEAYLLLANNSGGFNNAVNITNLYGMDSFKWKLAAINPGDYNGDGKTDLLLQVPLAEVQLAPAKYNAYTLIANNTGGFTQLNDVTNSTGIGQYGWGFTVRTGDFDGDGRTDLLFPNQNNADTSGGNTPMVWAEVAYASSSGSFGSASEIQSGVLQAWQWEHSKLTFADYNGDGRTDVLAQVPGHYSPYPTYVPNKAVLLLAKGSQLFTSGTDITTIGGQSAARMDADGWLCANVTPGDFNGDGKVDVVLKASVGCSHLDSPRLLYANGDQGASFATPINIAGLYGISAAKWQYTSLDTGDFNGDGKTDLFARSTSAVTTEEHLILESKGDGFKDGRVVTTSYGMTRSMWAFVDHVGDFDGDGDDDILLHESDAGSKTPPKILKASDSVSNVITAIENGYGSKTTITYKPSSFWGETSGNVPRTQTVSSIKVEDGRGNFATTNYSYTGAGWDPVERRHLGFRSVTATDPTGAYVENYFYQGKYYGQGQLLDSKSFNSSGWLMSRTYRTLIGSTSGSGPWVHLLDKEEISECNGDGTCKTQQKNYSYDSYGNVTNLVEHGDISVAGDERNTSYTYYPNVTTFITGLPAKEIMRAGTTTGGQILRQKQSYYDNGLLTSAPTKGDATRVEQWLDTTDTFIGNDATYDNFGNKLTETDPFGAVTTTTWEATYGRYPLSVTNALGHVSTVTWDYVCGQKATATDPNLAVTTYTYDNHCRITKESRADGGHTDTAYVNFGSPTTQYTSTTVDDGAGSVQWTASYFDGLGREWQSFNNNSETVETTYNSRGLVEKVSAPFGLNETKKFTTYEYDALQRVTRKTFADTSFQQFLYDDWTVTSCDELGKPRTRYTDAYGQIRKVREYVGKTCVIAPTGTLGVDMFDTVINYDLLGQQIGFTNAKGYVSSSVYDSLGRRTSRIDPDMGTWTYQYDEKNRLISQTDAKNQTIDLAYDDLDRLLVTYGNGVQLNRFYYDVSTNGIGRLSSNRRGNIGNYKSNTTDKEFTYDIMGRVVGEKLAFNTWQKDGSYLNLIRSTEYNTQKTYDGAGRVKTLTYPSGEVVTYGYDSSGRLSSMKSSVFEPSNIAIVSAATYNARGNLATRTLGNGVLETFTYDPNRFWLTGVSASLGATPIHSVTLQRNTRGEVTSRTNTLESNDNWSYIYDDLRRMTSATNTNNAFWSESFTFDEINRITSSSRLGAYNYAAPNSGKPAYAPETIAGATMQYDANGNMSSDGVTTLVFDIENRPINVGGITSEYDADGKRTRVGAVTTVGDIAEYDGDTGINTNYYLFGESRVASSANQQLTFYHGDHLNSASTMTDTFGGVIGRQVLSPYGRKLSTGGYTGPIGLAGQRLDITGLYHMGAREMNPSLAIFVTPDPSSAPDPEKPQTLSRYAYANNSPTNLVDPTGYAAEPSGYDKFSFWAHSGLSVLGTIPVVGIVADGVDLVYTLAEVPAGKSTWGDVGLATAGVVATAVPVVGDGPAAFAKIAARAARYGDEAAEVAAPIAKQAEKSAGRAASQVAENGPHKNSRAFDGETHVYAVRNPDGTVYKIGESAQGTRVRDGASKRAEQQVRKLNREVGPGHTSEIRKTFPNKDAARTYETNFIERYRRMYEESALPGNKTNR